MTAAGAEDADRMLRTSSAHTSVETVQTGCLMLQYQLKTLRVQPTGAHVPMRTS